jgi:hypothetical protein
LVEEEIIFSSLKHELLHLDGVIESLKKCIRWALKQRQVCEEEGVGYERTQIANAKLKEI